MTEDFEIEDDSERGTLGRRGSKSIGRRDVEPAGDSSVEVIEDELEPGNGVASTGDDYQEADKGIFGYLAEAASYITGAESKGSIFGSFISNERSGSGASGQLFIDDEPNRGGDRSVAGTSMPRRSLLQALGAGATAGGAAYLLGGSEESGSEDNTRDVAVQGERAVEGAGLPEGYDDNLHWMEESDLPDMAGGEIRVEYNGAGADGVVAAYDTELLEKSELGELLEDVDPYTPDGEASSYLLDVDRPDINDDEKGDVYALQIRGDAGVAQLTKDQAEYLGKMPVARDLS